MEIHHLAKRKAHVKLGNHVDVSTETYDAFGGMVGNRDCFS